MPPSMAPVIFKSPTSKHWSKDIQTSIYPHSFDTFRKYCSQLPWVMSAGSLWQRQWLWCRVAPLLVYDPPQEQLQRWALSRDTWPFFSEDRKLAPGLPRIWNLGGCLTARARWHAQETAKNCKNCRNPGSGASQEQVKKSENSEKLLKPDGSFLRVPLAVCHSVPSESWSRMPKVDWVPMEDGV